jgi:uncharacterized protein YcfJ
MVRWSRLGNFWTVDLVSTVYGTFVKTNLKRSLLVATLTFVAQAGAQVTFYENSDFQGRTFNTEQRVDNFSDSGFNDRASSVIVLSRRWEVCEHSKFEGQCVVLRPGRYASLAAMGINDRISSVRPLDSRAQVADERYSPTPSPVYDNRRRNNERLFQADVTSVRAVVGPPEQRCWVEREEVTQQQNSPNMPGTVVGAIFGGILGHQVGGGRGKDLATVGGAIAGGAIGSQVGRNGAAQQNPTQSVQRCSTLPGQVRADLWDVSYNFRGVEHRLQMTTPPGPTLTVNRRGEPRA